MAAHPHYLSRDQVAALLDERDTLRETVRQLTEALASTIHLPAAWGLSVKQEALLRAIRAAGPNVMHRERAMLAIYGTWEDAPDQRIVDAMMCKIRARLFAKGVRIEIETVFGRGWRMTPASCARFDELVAADRARWPAVAVARQHEARA